MERFREVMEFVGTAVDTAGVSVMVIGAIVATARLLWRRRRKVTGACNRGSAGWVRLRAPDRRWETPRPPIDLLPPSLIAFFEIAQGVPRFTVV